MFPKAVTVRLDAATPARPVAAGGLAGADHHPWASMNSFSFFATQTEPSLFRWISSKRSDFGIAPSAPAAMLSDEVTLIANGEFQENKGGTN